MDINDFIEKFAEAIETDASNLTVETEFRSLDDWNSLAVLSVIVMLDEEYGIQIENKDFKNLDTIADIVDYIEKHQEK